MPSIIDGTFCRQMGSAAVGYRRRSRGGAAVRRCSCQPAPRLARPYPLWAADGRRHSRTKKTVATVHVAMFDATGKARCPHSQRPDARLTGSPGIGELMSQPDCSVSHRRFE